METMLPSSDRVLSVLRRHEGDLRARGVETVTLFGSHARGESTPASDIDLAFRPTADFSSGGFDHFGRLEALRTYLAALLGRPVDLVEEPAIRPSLRHAIATDGVRAF
jgi:predicted nucleotidyltransferase